MEWYLQDHLNPDQVLKNLVTLLLCSAKNWMIVDKPRTAELDQLLNYSMEEAQVSPVMKTHCSLSDCP